MLWTSWEVSNSTGVIERVLQGDQTDTFYPISPEAIKADCDCTNYTEAGNLYKKWVAKWLDNKIDEYQPIDLYKGQELKPMLSGYLKSVGKFERAGVTDSITNISE